MTCVFARGRVHRASETFSNKDGLRLQEGGGRALHGGVEQAEYGENTANDGAELQGLE
jgi:hypothetical protein